MNFKSTFFWYFFLHSVINCVDFKYLTVWKFWSISVYFEWKCPLNTILFWSKFFTKANWIEIFPQFFFFLNSGKGKCVVGHIQFANLRIKLWFEDIKMWGSFSIIKSTIKEEKNTAFYFKDVCLVHIWIKYFDPRVDHFRGN